jgi:hypothetical protein
LVIEGTVKFPMLWQTYHVIAKNTNGRSVKQFLEHECDLSRPTKNKIEIGKLYCTQKWREKQYQIKLGPH